MVLWELLDASVSIVAAHEWDCSGRKGYSRRNSTPACGQHGPSPTRRALALAPGQKKDGRPGNTWQVTLERIGNQSQGSTTLSLPATTHFVTPPPAHKFRKSPVDLSPRETVQEAVFAAPIFPTTQRLLLLLFFFPQPRTDHQTNKNHRREDLLLLHRLLLQTFVNSTQPAKSWVFYDDNHHSSGLETDHNPPAIIDKGLVIAALSSAVKLRLQHSSSLNFEYPAAIIITRPPG